MSCGREEESELVKTGVGGGDGERVRTFVFHVAQQPKDDGEE